MTFRDTALGSDFGKALEAGSDISDIVATIVDRIVSQDLNAQDAFDAIAASQRHRHWATTVVITEALLSTVGHVDTATLHRYAQALTEIGALAAAECVLRRLAEGDEGDLQDELAGLRGRIAKQRYIQFSNNSNLRTAIEAYASAYALGKQPEWHGPNLVALLRRAERDAVVIPHGAPKLQVVIDDLEAHLSGPGDGLTFWQQSALVEISLAKNDISGAVEVARTIADADRSSPFEMGALLRQLSEVWGLEADHLVVQTLQQSHLSMGPGAFTVVPDTATLERVLGVERPVPLGLYQRGLEVAKSVCMVTDRHGSAVGTGFVIRGSSLFDGWTDELVLVTNAHVVHPEGSAGSLGAMLPVDATARFTRVADETTGQPETEVRDLRVLWSSDVSELDTTVLSLSTPPSLSEDSMELSMSPPSITAADPHVFVIGHPSGRSIELSIRGNAMLGVNSSRIHYRAPTEPGSSGSPVFDPTWRLVGVHHSGSVSTPRLDNPSHRYAANEALRIDAIRTAIASDMEAPSTPHRLTR